LKNGDAMKAIHYDAEGDILSVTFSDNELKQTGIELSDNLVLYYNPETGQPLKLIVISYQALLQASVQAPVPLDGLADAPMKIQTTVITLLGHAPLNAFLHLIKTPDNTPPAIQLHAVFTPDTLQTVAAGA
jgi:hypothetical protein